MKTFLLTVILVTPVLAFTQSRDTVFGANSINASQEKVFTVSAAKRIYLAPDLDTLFSDSIYRFKVQGVPLKNIVKFYFEGGTATFGDSTLILKTKPGNKKAHQFLKASVIAGSALKAVLVKNFFVCPDPSRAPVLPLADKPLVSLFWWNPTRPLPAYSVVNKEVILRKYSNMLSIENPSFPEKRYTVFWYEMTIKCGDSIQKFKVTGNRITEAVTAGLNQIKKEATLTITLKYFCGNERADELETNPYYVKVKEGKEPAPIALGARKR